MEGLRSFGKLMLATAGIMFLSSNAYAGEDLVINMKSDSGVEIFNAGSFNDQFGIIGSTTEDTKLYLGEIDFGDGNVYFGSSIELANEAAGMEGFANFYIGDPDDGGWLLNDIAVTGTGAWQYYREFRYNFYPEDEKRPKGVQKVFLNFSDGAYGNIKKVVFLGTELSDDEQGEKKDPVYEYISLKASEAEIIPGENPNIKYNIENNSIGWTEAGDLVKFSGVDFGDGSLYKQMAVVSSYGGNSFEVWLEIYIDDPEVETNMVAKMWTGRDFFWTVFAPIASNINQTVSGVHDVYVKWTGPTSLRELQIIEGTPWNIEDEDTPEIPEYIDVPLTENAYTIAFDAMGSYPNAGAILAKGTADGGNGARYMDGNLGYTSGGVVVRFDDVDMTNFTRIVVEHSSDRANITDSYFDFYVDLDDVEDYSDLSVYEKYEKVASVQAQGTANWSSFKKTSGDILNPLTGTHDLYMVFNFVGDMEAGANIAGVHLDFDGGTSVNEIASGEYKFLSGKDYLVIENAEIGENFSVYNIAGQLVETVIADSSVVKIALNSGIYLVKTKENTYKVIVY